jgi:N-acetylglutamate synthase-like GNAT family acetyltransferase
MVFTVRPAGKEDVYEMLKVYNRFTKQFVGSAARTAKSFQRMLRRKENLNWVALDDQDLIIGYVSARLEKQMNRGEFREIAVDPDHDFEQVAKPLVERVNSVFMEKKVSAIQAASLRNPWFEKLFPKYGFFESESLGVFMYAVLDARKLLNEISQVFIKRLNQIENWNGLLQIECEGHSIFLHKTGEEAKQIIWTNHSIDIKARLGTALLTRLIFGIADPVQSLESGELQIETSLDKMSTTRILRQLFPERQFLIMDYW